MQRMRSTGRRYGTYRRPGARGTPGTGDPVCRRSLTVRRPGPTSQPSRTGHRALNHRDTVTKARPPDHPPQPEARSVFGITVSRRRSEAHAELRGFSGTTPHNGGDFQSREVFDLMTELL